MTGQTRMMRLFVTVSAGARSARLRGRRVFGVLAILLVAAAGTAGAQATQDPNALIRQLGDETLAVLDDTSAPKRAQIDKMRSVFRRYFAVPEIGQFVLSRHWRQATPEQRAEYLELFEDLIVYAYAQRFGGYAGERLEIIGSRAGGNGATVVQSQVVPPDRSRSISVDWHVETVAGRPQIVDVVVEGVSLKLTQRSDFSAAIRQQGGDVAGLIALLRDKTADLKSDIEG